ncbi:MAG: ABC transporter substrate-binding protein [Azonexus sp.]|nr:ABC transporter substrate-binding protein [Azonexus sp.]
MATPYLPATLLAFLALHSPFSWAAPGNKAPIIVAQAADLSGAGADFSRDYSLGAKVYFDQINAQGGMNGHPITYRLKDTAGNPSQALSVSRELIAGGARVLLGPQGDSQVDALVQEAQGKPAFPAVFGAIGGRTGVPTGIPPVIRLRASRADEAAAIFKQLSSIGVVNFGLIAGNGLSEDALRQLRSVAESAGAKIVAQGRLDPNAPNGAEHAASTMVKARPQATLVMTDTLSAAQVFRHYRRLDPGAFLCATSEVNVKTLIAIMGAQAARGLILSQVSPNPAGIGDLAREHRGLMEKYADEPASPATLEGFIAAKVLVKTLQQQENGNNENWLPRGKLDLGGFILDFTRGDTASHFVELTVVNRQGKLQR